MSSPSDFERDRTDREEAERPARSDHDGGDSPQDAASGARRWQDLPSERSLEPGLAEVMEELSELSSRVRTEEDNYGKY